MDRTLVGTEESAGKVTRRCFKKTVLNSKKIPVLEFFFNYVSVFETSNFVKK